MKKILFVSILFISAKAMAQVPEDAVRYSWYPQNGTARTLAIGGAIGSLGGDISAMFVNPAGIGFFKTSEASITPGFLMNNVKGNYRGTSVKESKNAISFGPSGVALGFGDRNNSNQTNSFAIGFTQNASFNNLVHYKGLNNYSSFSEQFVEEFVKLNKNGYSIDDVLNENSVAPYTAAPALYTYLIDTVRVGGNLIVKGAPEYILDAGQALMQEMTKTTKGGIYELAFSFARNNNDKLLYGGTIGIPIVSYESNTLFSETDTSSNSANHFSSFSYNDNYTTKGAGINAKLGIIYKPQEYIRLGLAVHTPSYMTLTDSRRATLVTQVENPVKTFDVVSDIFTNNQRGESRYAQTSPWRAILSGSYVFREVEDVTKQRGFISADIEYVNHKGSRFSSQNDEPTEDEKSYYKQLNGVIKNIYKGNINFKIGGELKFNTIMARLGFGYYGSPYKDAPSKANKMTGSAGIGYRNKGFFIDLTYVQLITNDFDVPYRLESAQNTYASLKQNRGNVVATFGVKF
jgi:hypothetical protein